MLPTTVKLIQYIEYQIVNISMYFVDMFTFLYCTVMQCAFPGYLGVTLFEQYVYCHCTAHVFVFVSGGQSTMNMARYIIYPIFLQIFFASVS